jgi:hypothetical protein
MVLLTECETKVCKNKLQQLQWKEWEKRKTMQSIERRGCRGFKYNGVKNRQGNGQIQSGMEEDCIGIQDTRRRLDDNDDDASIVYQSINFVFWILNSTQKRFSL